MWCPPAALEGDRAEAIGGRGLVLQHPRHLHQRPWKERRSTEGASISSAGSVGPSPSPKGWQWFSVG
eukprot:3730103-Alexandrium_andersonii.AAC.1